MKDLHLWIFSQWKILQSWNFAQWKVYTCEYFHNEKKYICEILNNESAFASNCWKRFQCDFFHKDCEFFHLKIAKKCLVKNFTGESASIVHFFTNCSTNTKLFRNVNAYKFSICMILWRISQTAEEISSDLNLCVRIILQALTKRTNTKQENAYISEKFSIFKLFCEFLHNESSYKWKQLHL